MDSLCTPLCSRCSEPLEARSTIVSFLCRHMYCEKCARPLRVCCIGSCGAGEKQVAEDVQAWVADLETARRYGDKQACTRMLRDIKEGINVNAVVCRFARRGERCGDVEKCWYDHAVESNRGNNDFWVCEHCSIQVDYDFCPICKAMNPTSVRNSEKTPVYALTALLIFLLYVYFVTVRKAGKALVHILGY